MYSAYIRPQHSRPDCSGTSCGSFERDQFVTLSCRSMPLIRAWKS